MKKTFPVVNVTLENIVGGGQAIATMQNGCRLFVWGGLPGENVDVQITKQKSKLAEGYVVGVTKPSINRIDPNDADSYLSTSPWQIMNFKCEQEYKSQLITDAYLLHHINLSEKPEIYSDNNIYGYRNKVEFSWYWNKTTDTLDLAFFKRGAHGKIPVNGTSLAHANINKSAILIRDWLRSMPGITASTLKTLLMRCDKKGNVIAQIYVKEPDFNVPTDLDLRQLSLTGFQVIFSNPKSPASVITKVLMEWGTGYLNDSILGVPFRYTAESFFQINLPVYEQALKDMKKWVITNKPLVDLYSGVGTIGLTIGRGNVTLVEINESAVNEMRRNIKNIDEGREIKAVLSPSEYVVDLINSESIIIVDPPRAGLHEKIISRLIEVRPKRIIYLSCNPVTQARDVSMLIDYYSIACHKGYNFFPRTPHIEHLVVLDLIS